VEHLSGAPLKYAPAPITNIRLGWKGLPETNTIIKSFIALCPGANVIKQYAVNYGGNFNLIILEVKIPR
jgi:hypothetical protein